ncbi:MAG: hypothetical protein WCO00_16890 [Rhodospirillaceae bacterium]
MIPPASDASASHAPHRNDRLIALFLLGVVAVAPPLLRVFGVGATVLGWPLLFIYVFVVWGAVVALIAVDIEFRDTEKAKRPEKSAPHS